MENNKVRLYGSGGHSNVIKHILEDNGKIITDIYDDNYSNGENGSTAHGIRGYEDTFPHQGSEIIIALGVNKFRYEISKLLKSKFGKAIHQSAIISRNVKILEGTVVIAGAIVNCHSHIGKHVILNTASSVGHDCIVGDYVHISPNVALCGHVEVGEGTHVGAGTVVIQEVKIGKWCVIGAGSVIVNDVPDYSVVVGNPGKIIKTNKV